MINVFAYYDTGLLLLETDQARYTYNYTLYSIQISYASSLSELSNRDSFPNFFRTYPSDTIFTPAIVSLIQEYGWKRIAFITQDENLFTEVNALHTICLEAVNNIFSPFCLQTLAQVQDPLEEAGIEVANRMISSPLPMTGLGANFFVSNNYIDRHC